MYGQTPQVPYLHAAEESFYTVTAITLGDAVTYDSNVSSSLDRCGVKTTPATADLAPIIGIALESVTGTTAAPAKIRIARQGHVLKAKAETNVTAFKSLVTNSVAGELIEAAAADESTGKVSSLTAEGTLSDGTVAAGFCSVWLT